MIRVKVLLLGPCKVGKTTIANFLSEAVDNPEPEYHPTQGVRILEYESVNPINHSKTEVELWDCSGDAKYDACWPALQQGVHGIILVLDPSRTDHIRYADRALGILEGSANLGSEHCLVLLCPQGSTNSIAAVASRLPGTWSHARHIKTDLREGGSTLRREVSAFVNHLMDVARAHTDKEELSLLGLR